MAASDCRRREKLASFVTGPSAGSDAGRVTFEEESFPEGMSPQGKLECLKQALKLRMQQMQDQGETIRELECQLKRTKRDLACLREKCSVTGRSEVSNELASYESKLKKFREVLMCATQHIEKALGNMPNCQTCNKCTCREVFADERRVVQFVRRDLELLEMSKTAENLSDEPDTDTEICRQEDDRTRKSFNATDVDAFRAKAVIGVAALEEMREQLDILHELIRKHYEQLPCDYEKCQREECESKFDKLHAEFDEVTDDLCALIESFHAEQSRCEASSCDASLSERTEKLMEEQRRLREEICEQQSQLEKLRKDLKEVEVDLCEKRCQSDEQEREIKSREQEITRLREGVKGFREQLKDLQIDILDNVSNGTQLVPSIGSCTSLSNLSVELQELCLILKSSQSSFPGIIEKCREENNQMKEQVCRLEKRLQNKDETASILQQSLKMRDGQIEELNCKLQSMNCEVTKLRQELEEKGRLICNLQDSMRKAKEFELKMKDESIEALQFEVCDLDCRLKAVVKEVLKKGKDLEVLQDEILYVSSKNFCLSQEIDLLEPKLGKLQKSLAVYEATVCQLQRELKNRENEVESLYEKVRELEDEMECELKKCEQRSHEDSEYISSLGMTIRDLENEVKCLRARSRRVSPDRSSRSSDNQTFDESEETPCKVNLRNTVRQLKCEVKVLKRKLREAQRHEDITGKVADLENIIRQGESRQEEYNDKIRELQRMLEDTVCVHESEKRKMVQKLCKEENENVKNKLLISKLKESIKCKSVTESTLKGTIRRFTCDLEAMRVENEELRAKLESSQRVTGKGSGKVCRGMEDVDKIINELEEQKSNLKAQCCNLKSELEKEEKVKKSLEEKINALNDTLASKTLQLNQVSQNYKCTSAKAQEALTKLKDAEDRLKCMNTEMSKRRACDEDEEAADADEMMEKRDLESSLEEKTAECSDLMSEVQCLQVKLKTMQGEYISSQANKDCELSRLNREITRLESEVDLLEKDNCKLWGDFKKAQDELENRSRMVDTYKDELEKKDKELREAVCEKNNMQAKVDDLKKRLEEMCLDNTMKEKEGRELREEIEKLQKEVSESECELCEMRRDLEALQTQYAEASDKLKSSEKKAQNFKKLYSRVSQENADLQEAKCRLEKELAEASTQNFMLKEKLLCSKKQKEVELKKIMAENSNVLQEKMRLSARLKELTCQVRNLEEKVIPHMEDEIARKDRCIESYKMELHEANASSQRMRDGSMRVIQCTRKYLNAQRCANDAVRSRSDCSKDMRHYGNNDNRDLEEQLKSVTRMNDHLYFELQNDKNDYHDTEPRSFSPLPWGCSNVERDDSSPEYMTESGFQSMQPSPTNMNYISDYDMKRTPSQWNTNIGRHMDSTEYSPCRSGSVR